MSVCCRHEDDGWLDVCWRLTWHHLYTRWRGSGWAQSLMKHCRWLVSNLTSCYWHRRSEFGRISRIQTNPLQTLGCRSRTVNDVDWSTVSKTELKYNRTRAVISLLSTAHVRSLYTQSIAVSVEWPRKYDDNVGLEICYYRQLYSCCVQSSMLHGSETWPVRKENEVALQWAEMRMVRWMCM